jgi:hypothetical protein
MGQEASGNGVVISPDAQKDGGWLDNAQMALDGAGLFPGLGIFPDGLNVLISAGRGDWAGARLSAAAMIPIAGQAVTWAKLANVAKKAGKVSPSTLHERGTKIPGGRKIDDTLAGSNKIKNSQGETFKRVDFAPSKPHAGLSPHTHPNFRNTLPDGSVRSGVSGHGQSVTRRDIIDAARDGGQRTGGF